MLTINIIAALAALAGVQEADIQDMGKPPIQDVVLHPFTPFRYKCSEHHEGELPYIGDALGSDCSIGSKEGDGSRNEDYDSWRKPVLAPFDGTVTRVRINPVTNEPRVLGKPPASTIKFERADGVIVLLAHVREVVVEAGDTVTAGQYVGRIGNNGMSTGPHIHVGAWRGEEPLQIRWDLRALAKLRSEEWVWPDGIEP